MNKLIANKYDYDFQNDSVFFYSEGNQYMSSVEVDGIIIDFSEKDNLMSLEILDASSKFQVSKSELLKIKHFDAIININKENIIVSMKLVIEKRNQLFDRCLEATTINSMNLPSGTQEIAVTC